MSGRMHRLVDCDPRWVLTAGAGPERGISFACPEGHDGCRHVIPFTPALDGAAVASWQQNGAVWQRTGDTFDTLSLTPSIRRGPVYASREAAISEGAEERYLEPTHLCALHIFITNGGIQFCGDSR